FFQAEDGIRDKLVTGVQTCALPICNMGSMLSRTNGSGSQSAPVPKYYQLRETLLERISAGRWPAGTAIPPEPELCREFGVSRIRSEERRVGKEGRSGRGG